jgi:hypothetical protein
MSLGLRILRALACRSSVLVGAAVVLLSLLAAASASAAVSNPDMQVEIAGLSRAQQLLHAGNAARALSALSQLTQRVPRGALMEERDATRALAQCALARSSSTADAFIAHYPNSIHAAGVRSACERAD